jgi:hypothetical protein
MSNLYRRSLLLVVVGLLVLILAPAGLAQETPADSVVPAGEPGQVVDIPKPAVEIAPEAPAAVEQAWTFRYLIPTSLVIALVVVVGSIIAYFLKVVRTRYRLIQ